MLSGETVRTTGGGFGGLLTIGLDGKLAIGVGIDWLLLCASGCGWYCCWDCCVVVEFVVFSVAVTLVDCGRLFAGLLNAP